MPELPGSAEQPPVLSVTDLNRLLRASLEDSFGELWVGGVVRHKWGPADGPLELDASVRRYLAYGPNVTETSADYWRADVLLKWTF